SSMLKLFPGRLFAVRLFDTESGALSLVYATGRLRNDRRDKVQVTTRALEEQGLTDPIPVGGIEISSEYVPLFYEQGSGFDVAIGSGRRLIGVLSVQYGPGLSGAEEVPPSIGPVALQLSATLRYVRLLRESVYLR